ncbi:MAG TPA: LamG-like jellyroll fold domain-containing protein, partial [Candidatus Dormibacteraeota bacterium]|nr:LamG-like jellyroll fold domain-containing protein [Candidatus Dormibacteraeota bacterium]
MSNLITSGSIVLRPDNLLRLFRTSVLCGFLALCFSGSPAFAAVCIPPPSGLVSWWTAEGNATDAVGTNNGSFQGSATANGVGMVGSAFSFNGNSSYIQIPDSPSEKPTNLTIEAWVNFTSLDSTGTGAPAGDQYIVFKQNSRTMLFEGYDVSKTRVAGGDVFRFQIASSAGTEIDLHATNHISTGTWYHIAAVRGSNFMQIYVNGNLENQTSVSFPQDYGTLPLYFGTSGESFWDRKLYGLLDEVSLYNRVLSSNEIAAIYVAGAAGKCGAARILGQPQSQSVTLGSNATFTVSASGTAPLAYQWQRSNTNLNNAGNISGASSSALTISAVSTNDAASYRVIVSNIVGAVTSSPASLTVVIPAPPQVVNLPATGIAGTFATGNGQIVTAGSSTPSVTLFYGPADGGTNPGGWQSSASAGLQTGSFSQVLSGLATNTTYYFTARAVNNAGTAWATPSLTFKTASNNPAVNYAAVLSQHNDDSRTGANLKETILTPTNVNTNQFGLIYTRLVDDQIYAQPLVMTNVNIAGRGLRNIVLIATVNDTVYAFDADDPTVVTPYWQVSFLGPNIVPPSWDDILASPCGNFRNISGYFGIVGTPVIDPLTGTMYVVARTKEFGTNYVQRLHALSVADGSERPNSPVVITGSVPGTGAGASGGIVTFNPFMQNQRPGLAISKGVVYVGWTSHCDWDPYHGWLMGFDASTLQRVCIYNTAPNGSEAGIWMSGAAPAVDTNGNLYISVGNGTVGVTGNPRDTTNRGQSFLKLTPSGTNLNITSWFTPYNWSNLNLQDLDLGSAGILLIPGTSYAFSGGKQGIVYLVDRDNMGGLS